MIKLNKYAQSFYINKSLRCDLKRHGDEEFKLKIYLDENEVGKNWIIFDIMHLPKNENDLKEFSHKILKKYLIEFKIIVDIYEYLKTQ